MTELEIERFKLYQEKVKILDNIGDILYNHDDLDEEEKIEKILMEMEKHFK